MNDLCPYCTRGLLAPGIDSTDEHVFVRGLGGRTKIRACKDCNSKIGSEVEGGLQAAGTLLALEKALREGVGPSLRVKVPGGGVFDVDLHSGQHRAPHPVVEEKRDRDTLLRTVRGPEEQVRAILTGMARKYGFDVEAALASAKKTDASTLETTLVVDLSMEARLAAKIALAAGTYCLGDTYISSALAARLRDIVWGKERALVEPASKLKNFEATGILATAVDEKQCFQLRLPKTDGIEERTVIRVQMFGRYVPASHVLVVYGEMPHSLILLHEPAKGPPQCLEDYLATNPLPNVSTP